MFNQLAAIESLPMPPTQDGSDPRAALPLQTQQPADVNDFLEYTVKQQTDENTRLQYENYALNYKIHKMEKAVLETQTNALEDGSKKIMQDEINRLNKLVAELKTSNKKHVEKISGFEKQHGDNNRTEKKVLETTIDEKKRSHAPLQPLVIKKIVINEHQKVWQCYSTLDGNKESANLSLFDKELVVDGFISGKQLILDGVVTQYENDPFNFRPNAYCFSRHHVCHLLSKVLSCNLTDLFLHNQAISLEEFEKLVSSGSIKNLYFHAVDFKDYQADPVQKILENVPNIEKFAYYLTSYIKKVTFDDDKLPFFTKLLEFKLSKIPYSAFDVQSFFAFMKKYPNARFHLSFLQLYNLRDKDNFEEMKRMLESLAPVGKLHIQSK